MVINAKSKDDAREKAMSLNKKLIEWSSIDVDRVTPIG